MTVIGAPVTREGLTYIVSHLRARDRTEIFALRWDDSEAELVEHIFAMAGALWQMWLLDGEPVAVNGVIMARPGVVIGCAFGTDKWLHAVRPITRWSREFVFPALRGAGYHRGEAYSLVSHTDSRRWIEGMGGEIEALLKGYGRHREDFLLYAWDLTREGAGHVSRRKQSRTPTRQLGATAGAGTSTQ